MPDVPRPDATGRKILIPGERSRRTQVKPASVLAALADAYPKRLSADDLVVAVWGKYPPSDPINTVRVHVCMLRKSLAGTRWSVIHDRALGYRLLKEEE